MWEPFFWGWTLFFPTLFLGLNPFFSNPFFELVQKHVRFVFRTYFGTAISVRARSHCKMSQIATVFSLTSFQKRKNRVPPYTSMPNCSQLYTLSFGALHFVDSIAASSRFWKYSKIFQSQTSHSHFSLLEILGFRSTIDHRARSASSKATRPFLMK